MPRDYPSNLTSSEPRSTRARRRWSPQHVVLAAASAVFALGCAVPSMSPADPSRPNAVSTAVRDGW